jgi:hypothetical protein
MRASSLGPGRVVDRDNYGWYQAGDGQGGFVYCVNYQTRIPDYSTLVAKRGPVRPVLPVDQADIAELDRLFILAGSKAVTSLAAAIELVFHTLRAAAGGLNASSASYEYAMRTIKAGRAGSWESELLTEVMLFGNDLNLSRKAPKSDVTAKRAAGPNHRVNSDARDQMAAIITRWVTAPDRYTEVAETLASIVSGYADQHGPGGWRAIADQWLQSPTFGGPGFKGLLPALLLQVRALQLRLELTSRWPMPKVRYPIRVSSAPLTRCTG